MEQGKEMAKEMAKETAKVSAMAQGVADWAQEALVALPQWYEHHTPVFE